MLQRLRDIADGKLRPTQAYLNFFSHELRESVRYQNLGYRTGQPLDGDAAYDLWNNAHTATLEDFRRREEGPGMLYHMSTGRWMGGETVNETQLKILELIEANSGSYSWYQLDRCLSESGVEHAGQLMPLLRELVAEGLIESAPGPNPAQPVYSITAIGVSAIRMAGRHGA